jgi:ParB-like chromosome segregation protein Spo0J
MTQDKKLTADKWPASKIEIWPVADLVPYVRNARMHPAEQIDQIAASMERFGFTIPMLVAEDGTIIAGHGRLMAAAQLGLAEVPVMVARGWSDEDRRLYTLADNRLAETSEWDPEMLRLEVDELRTEIGIEDLSFIGFSSADLAALIPTIDTAPAEAEVKLASLADRFGAVPFSVLNAREGWWMDRKRKWLSTGIRSELGRGESAATGGSAEPLSRARAGEPSVMKNGKRPAAAFGQDLMRGEGKKGTGGVLMEAASSADPSFYLKKGKVEKELGRKITTAEFLADHYEQPEGSTVAATGTSIFDPVLCELMYRWFAPGDGMILDPFAGGSVRGIVASALGRSYTGIELRAEQVEANRAQAETICEEPVPAWIAGDSLEMDTHLDADFRADFLFSCPPYADLEVYSDDPRDISSMDYDGFLSVYRQIIAKGAARLADDRFAAFVVGEVRGGREGAYRNFVGDTIAAFRDAGLHYYNEMILITPAGSLPIRIGKQFNASRKVGKTHQNILVFCKGDPRRATEACGAIEIEDVFADNGFNENAGFEVDAGGDDGE